MYPLFFPEPAFGWSFYAILLGFLAVASYTDLRYVVIPKPLTLSLLGVGVVVTVVRCAWLGSVKADMEGAKVWLLPATSAGMGAVDGLLFALAGFAASFAFFFVLWILGVAKGGDVKLFAALGTWFGPLYFLALFIVAAFFVAIGTIFGLGKRIARRGAQRTFSDIAGGEQNVKKGKGQAKRPQLRETMMTYSLSTALSAAVVVPFLFAVDLKLRPPTPPKEARVSAQP